MYSPIQLQAIKFFGDKTLSFGCIVEIKSFYHKRDNKIFPWFYTILDEGLLLDDTHWVFYEFVNMEELDYEILWHEPHLHDLFRVAEERGFYVSMSPEITRIYKEFWWEPIETILIPSMPPLSQPHLSEIVNLFSK